MLKLVLAEDHHLIRTALVTYLNQENDIEIVAEVGDGAYVIATVERHRPNVLLLDVHMPNHKVLQTVAHLRSNYPDLKILAMSAYREKAYVVGLLQAGVKGYILKDDARNTLPDAIRAVSCDQRWVSSRVMDVLLAEPRSAMPTNAALTQREVELIQQLASGMKNAEIAKEMHLSEQTVKNYLRNVFGKLNVQTRVQAVVTAIQWNIIQLN